MRTQEQTLLARFGFRDPDHGDERHYLACKYLALPDTHERLVRCVDPSGLPQSERRCVDHGQMVVFEQRSYTLERPIKKDGGFVVGFLDLVLQARWAHVPADNAWCIWSELVVEVKVRPVPIDDIVKQVALYMEFVERRCPFVVATAFDLRMSDVDVLRTVGAHHVRLGRGFETYLQRAAHEAAAASPEL
jgi:hypothetical protein